MATNLDRIIQMIRTLGKVEEEGAVAITNNIGGGNIAGAPQMILQYVRRRKGISIRRILARIGQ